MKKSIAQIKLELLKADGGQVPSGPSPDIAAKLAELKEQLRQQGIDFNRRQQGIINLEKVAGPVKLLTDKAKGGLTKFLAESKVKDRLYHTTSKDFASFDPNADERGNGMMFFSDEPFHHPDKEQTISMPVHVRVKKIFDARKSMPKATVDWIKKNSDLIHKELSDYNNNRGLGFAENYFDPSKPLDPNKYIKRLKSSDWQAIEAVPSLVRHLKSTGHDAIKAYEEGLNTYGLFDPTQIKSAIGNRGTYDPNNPDITKARGGPIHLAIGGQGPRNWMKGVEDVINPLKQTVGFMTPDRVAEQQRSIDAARRILGDNAPRATLEQMEREIQQSHRAGALNKWIDSNLGNYIRKQMATPDDPIRKLAEEGIVHVPFEQIGMRYGADRHRTTHGGEQLAQSNAAKTWEDASDMAVGKTTVGDVLRLGQNEGMKKHVEPWMEKADPKTEVFHPTDSMQASYLGFDHLVDILKEDLANGRIRPDQLHKVSIEHAVRRAHEYDQEKKKAMAEAQLKATEGMPIHKEYPEGYKWIELALNPELPEGHSMTPAGTYVDPQGNESIHHPNYAKLDDALKYEGDTMGHCVGGYTPDVVKGKSRIFSLRDAKNEPHVTVEVNPIATQRAIGDLPRPEREALAQSVKDQYFNGVMPGASSEDKYWELLDKAYNDKYGEPAPAIKQIKGKGNAKPKKDYIPYVQDFVKSGNWSHVGDLKNAEMKQPAGFLRSYLEEKGVPHTKYMTEKEHDAHEADYLLHQLKPDNQAHGGIIHKAEGGSMDTPDLAQSRLRVNQRANPALMDNIGLDEALDMNPKTFITPDPKMSGGLPVGGVDKVGGLPIGGVDQSPAPGMQFAPQAPQQPQQNAGAPQNGQPSSAGASSPAQQPPSNILSLTPQGRALGAMAPQGMAKGGRMSPKEMALARFNVEKMADGGRKKPKFAIAPAQEPAKGPEHFTPYDKHNPSMKGLATAFDEAIAHHLSLSPEERMKNSIRASEAVGDIIGRTLDGKVKDLLGKNAKLLKSEKGKDDEAIKLPDGRGVETTGLALAPAYREGNFDTCPNHQSCKEECLGKTSGNYFKLGGGQDLSEFKGPRLNSLLKTHAFLHDPHNFAVKLHDEISDAKAIAAQNGNHLGTRLNVLSDINPRVHKAIIEAHPDVTFYDYTKNNTDPIAPNHHYTYSSTGVSQPGVENQHTNWKSMRRRLEGGDNVAMAFSHKDHLPEFVHDQETGHKFRVVDGDTHDFRPLDIQPEGEHGVVIGLKNKKATGKMDEAHLDSHGFFVHYDPQLKMAVNEKGQPVYAREKSTRISPKTGKPMLGETIPQNKVVNIQPQKGAIIHLTNDGEKE